MPLPLSLYLADNTDNLPEILSDIVAQQFLQNLLTIKENASAKGKKLAPVQKASKDKGLQKASLVQNPRIVKVPRPALLPGKNLKKFPNGKLKKR